MQQEPLFHEDIYEAIRTAVQALGGMKRVGSSLKPDLPADKAGEWLANCLNRTRQEKLDAEQIQFISRDARKTGCHAIAVFQNSDAGYMQPVPVEPEDEAAELKRQFIASVKQQGALVKRLEKLGIDI